jgi:hypothetical protein
MPSPFVLESMEIMAGAALAVVAVGSVVFTVVGALTYLLTREPAESAAASGAGPEGTVARPRQAA